MNVLFIAASIGYGGAEKMINFASSYLSDNECSVTVINLDISSQYVNEKKQQFGPKVNIISLGSIRGNEHIYRIKFIFQVAKRIKADVIVAFTMFPNFYARIVSLMTGIPSIISERGDPNTTFTNSLKDRFIRSVINTSEGAIFQTKEASCFYSKRLQKRGIVIPNPIFLTNNELPRVSIDDRPKTIVSVGRLQNIQKRYDVMLYAFKEFSKQHPDYILKIYGSGEDEKFIRELISELELYDKVLLLGVIKNPVNYIYNEGIFIITSDYEGIPNALLEAMAVGLPVVATDCSPGGARLLINNNVNGQLVPIRDVKAIADALGKYASDPIFAEQCANNARSVLDVYSPSKIGAQWFSYLTCIAGV